MKASIVARSPGDNSLRTWGISIDKVPTGNWRRDDSIIKSERHSGDEWVLDIPVPDGDHKLYYIVSDTSRESGGYAGEVLLDTAGFNFTGIDNDTISEWPIKVKNGVATRGQPSSQATSEDIETTSNRFGSLRELGNRIKNMTRQQKQKTVTYGGIAVAIPVAAYVIYKVAKKSRRF